MNSIVESIDHDHMYFAEPFSHRLSMRKTTKTDRVIRKKSDIETDGDREEYSRRRQSNNTACRHSRLHQRFQSNWIVAKCNEYEILNRQLNDRIFLLNEVIEMIKSQLRSTTIRSNQIEEQREYQIESDN